MSVSLPELSRDRLTDASPAPSGIPSPIARGVGLCVTRAWLVVPLVIVLCATVALYITVHFSMTTDTSSLLSSHLPWRIREAAFNAMFPQDGSDVVVVVDGQTPELSDRASERLARSLGAQKGPFRSVRQPDGGAFWAHERLLFAPLGSVKEVTIELLKMQPFLGSMASDPSLRGLANTLSLTLRGVDSGLASSREFRAPLRALADALEDVTLGKPTFFSWVTLMTGRPPSAPELRHVILIDPELDFAHLQPGQTAIDAIRAAARRLQLDSAHGVRVRVTGSIALKDDEFATLTQGAPLIASLAAVAIAIMLWLAVRSVRMIIAILMTMLAGLLCATGLGLVLFHRFNLISVAFIPLFVGMGMDFAIQVSVRYRAERISGRALRPALVAMANAMGKSLTLAALAIGAGFLAFAPTAYYGVSQLGVIAGFGMLAALSLSLTLLPALITVTRAPGIPWRPLSPKLTRMDDYVLGHRRLIVGISALAAALSVLLLPWLRFDFNPMHLRSIRVQSVAALLDLMRDPGRSPNTLELVRPSLAAADRLAARFREDPTVYSARTLSSFIPTHQSKKITLIADAANLMELTLNPPAIAPSPTDSQVIDALKRTATELRQTSFADGETRAYAQRLADEFDRLARGSPSLRAKASETLIPGFLTTLREVRDLLSPRPVSIATLPAQIVRQWETADGRARVSIAPKGDSNDNAVLRRFVFAGRKIAPDATGTAVYIQAYARAVVDAFIEAGALSFLAISCLLFVALRRIRDVAITMAPILLTALLTLGTCVVIEQPLNFANIIALPLLFGMGVAFHIYFVMSWRSGNSHLLTSSLARGVFFSALATATGFGSLWASKHPGTASMGKLLMISLVWTLLLALLFQPALMSLVKQRAPIPEATR